jgi:hypothetical protein
MPPLAPPPFRVPAAAKVGGVGLVSVALLSTVLWWLYQKCLAPRRKAGRREVARALTGPASRPALRALPGGAGKGRCRSRQGSRYSSLSAGADDCDEDPDDTSSKAAGRCHDEDKGRKSRALPGGPRKVWSRRGGAYSSLSAGADDCDEDPSPSTSEAVVRSHEDDDPSASQELPGGPGRGRSRQEGRRRGINATADDRDNKAGPPKSKAIGRSVDDEKDFDVPTPSSNAAERSLEDDDALDMPPLPPKSSRRSRDDDDGQFDSHPPGHSALPLANARRFHTSDLD